MVNPNVGAPDWQRGVVSADSLLAGVAANISSTTVNLPPNAKTLVVVKSSVDSAAWVKVKGATTGRFYTGSQRPSDVSLDYADAFMFFSVAPSLDQSVTIINEVAPSEEWYVYITSGVYAVDIPLLNEVVYTPPGYSISGVAILGNDGSNFEFVSTDTNGRQVPLVPTVGYSQAVAAGTTQLVAASSSGGNYLFSIDVIDTSGGANTLTFTDASGNTIGIVALAAADPSFTFELQGFRVTTALSVTSTAAATIVVRYAPGP